MAIHGGVWGVVGARNHPMVAVRVGGIGGKITEEGVEIGFILAIVGEHSSV